MEKGSQDDSSHIIIKKTILHLSKLLNNFLIRIEVRQQHFWWRIFRICCGSQLKLRIQQTSDFYSSLVISRMITCFKYNRNLQLSVRLLYVILDTGAGTEGPEMTTETRSRITGPDYWEAEECWWGTGWEMVGRLRTWILLLRLRWEILNLCWTFGRGPWQLGRSMHVP